MDCSPPGSSVHGISQAGILEWIAISFSRGFFRPRDRTCISCIGVCVCAKSHRQILYHWPPNGTVLSSFALSFMLGSVQQNLCTGQVPGPWWGAGQSSGDQTQAFPSIAASSKSPQIFVKLSAGGQGLGLSWTCVVSPQTVPPPGGESANIFPGKALTLRHGSWNWHSAFGRLEKWFVFPDSPREPKPWQRPPCLSSDWARWDHY